MSEISGINLGLPKTNLNQTAQSNEPEVKDAKQPDIATGQSVDPKAVLDAMNARANYNVAGIGINNIDPKKYLSPERMKDIEASMTQFTSGVDSHLEALNQEFGHLGEYTNLSETDKYEMAAKSFAQV